MPDTDRVPLILSDQQCKECVGKDLLKPYDYISIGGERKGPLSGLLTLARYGTSHGIV